MRRGFIYNTALCVNCNACNAACMLENGFQAGTRAVYTWNEDAVSPFPVVNLSLACNHCSDPACLKGCPARAYSVDPSGTVIHHPEKCMGCSYCTWRCPYNAPKINHRKGYIEKCHFCFQRNEEGIEPACVTACPTGAIKITLDDTFAREVIWFPETGIDPAVKISGVTEGKKQIFIPSDEENELAEEPGKPGRAMKEWSLLTFSLLVMTASVLIIINLFSESGKYFRASTIALFSALFISLTHLGVKANAWRAPLHFLSSPLSWEIVMVGLQTILSILYWIYPSTGILIAASVASLLSLVAVDMVYLEADRSVSLKLHSGQAFFSTLLAVSFFSHMINAFIIFTLLAAASIVFRHRRITASKWHNSLFYFRALSLPLVLMLVYLGSRVSQICAVSFLIAGIVSDRILFYEEFSPENLIEKISDNFKEEYEKERY